MAWTPMCEDPEGQLLGQLGSSIEPNSGYISDVVVRRARTELDELRRLDFPELIDAVHRSIHATIRAGVDSLTTTEEFVVPSEAISLARMWGRLNFSLRGILRLHGIAHDELTDRWLSAARDFGSGVSLPDSMLQFSLRSLFRCVELTSDAVVSEYQEARWRARSRANDQRLGIVRQVLTGHHANAEDLRYDLDSFHLGLVAWGPDADQAVRALAGDLDLSYLSVCSDGEETWGWLGSTEALSRQADRRLARFRPPGQAALAVGLPSLGLDGFRRSHSQAQLARRIALWCPAPLTLYRDVALEAVVSEERPVVQDFIRQELGELAEFGGRAEVLRATLDAYFACAQNATAAAARLEIHNQTVRYRLRTIEETIGHALASRSAELQLALRLHPLYVEADRAVSDDRRDVGEQVGPGRP